MVIGWLCIRFHFLIQASWYCVTNGNISFSFLLFVLGVQTPFREFYFWWQVFYQSLWVASVHQAFFFQFKLFSSKVVSEELFRRILKASPLTNPFLTLGGSHEVKCGCKKVSICLKCVFASRIDFSLNLVPLYTAMSKNAVSVKCFGRELNDWVMQVCSFNEGFDVWFTHVPYVTEFSICRRDNDALGLTLGRYRFYQINY